jgi:hypothetical protein
MKFFHLDFKSRFFLSQDAGFLIVRPERFVLRKMIELIYSASFDRQVKVNLVKTLVFASWTRGVA